MGPCEWADDRHNHVRRLLLCPAEFRFVTVVLAMQSSASRNGNLSPTSVPSPMRVMTILLWLYTRRWSLNAEFNNLILPHACVFWTTEVDLLRVFLYSHERWMTAVLTWSSVSAAWPWRSSSSASLRSPMIDQRSLCSAVHHSSGTAVSTWKCVSPGFHRSCPVKGRAIPVVLGRQITRLKISKIWYRWFQRN